MIRFLAFRQGQVVQRHEFDNTPQGDLEWRFMLDTSQAQCLEFSPRGGLLRASGMVPLALTLDLLGEALSHEIRRHQRGASAPR